MDEAVGADLVPRSSTAARSERSRRVQRRGRTAPPASSAPSPRTSPRCARAPASRPAGEAGDGEVVEIETSAQREVAPGRPSSELGMVPFPAASLSNRPARPGGAGRGARGPVPRARCDVAPGRDPSQERGWDSNPRSRAHEAREDGRTPLPRSALRRPPAPGRSAQCVACSVTRRPWALRCCPSHSPALRPWIARRRMRDRNADVLRGGALEPGARVASENAQAKAAVTWTASFTAPKRAGTFLSEAGPRFLLELLQAEHHLVVRVLCFASGTTKATLWVALG